MALYVMCVSRDVSYTTRHVFSHSLDLCLSALSRPHSTAGELAEWLGRAGSWFAAQEESRCEGERSTERGAGEEEQSSLMEAQELEQGAG